MVIVEESVLPKTFLNTMTSTTDWIDAGEMLTVTQTATSVSDSSPQPALADLYVGVNTNALEGNVQVIK